MTNNTIDICINCTHCECKYIEHIRIGEQYYNIPSTLYGICAKHQKEVSFYKDYCSDYTKAEIIKEVKNDQ